VSGDKPNPGETAELRYRAERRLKRLSTEMPGPGSSDQTQRLVHELQVHQIELEMQNEELRNSRSQVEKALERYTDLYDFAPVGYFTLLADSTVREVNLPGARLLNLERSQVLGGRFRLFVSNGTRPIFDSWLKQIFATHARHSCIVTLPKEGQAHVDVEIEATLSPDQLEARVVVVDITARQALEERVREAQKIEVIGQLAGGVAHEFNNILAASLLNLEMLQMRSQSPEETQTSLHDLEMLTKRAASLTQKLLLFSRRQAMQPVQLEVNAALKNLLKVLERLFGENITSQQLASHQELWVEADPIMLDQAITNLCLNAKDAMEDGGTITLETSLVNFSADDIPINSAARPGRFVCLRVSDTGCGIHAETLKHLFEPFFTTKEIGEGSGLGLAATYGIVHQHKGWMTVESVVGRGTGFHIYLPVSERAESIGMTAVQQLSLKGQNETILLVEDEAALLFANGRALAALGYRVLSAPNGPKATELWTQHSKEIDLLLTDMRMPGGISGLELAEKLRETKPSLKVIITSGYSMEMVRDRAAGNSNYAFLAKPFDMRALSEAVRGSLVRAK
jgi:signal transduction histidine kinase/ActR/RegA family two-component response regulator